jgi:hypothetical protein
MNPRDLEPLTFGCNHSAAVTPADTGGLNLGGVTAPDYCRRLYIGGGAPGDVKIDTIAGESAVLFKKVPVGSFLDVHAKRVYSTGTTATDIVALW